MSIAYINYHRKPRTAFMSIQEFNEAHGTEIELNEEFENQFKMALMAARYETDPNDYIQHTFGLGWKGKGEGKKLSLRDAAGLMFKPTKLTKRFAGNVAKQMRTKEHAYAWKKGKQGASFATRKTKEGLGNLKDNTKEKLSTLRSKFRSKFGKKKGPEEETEEQVYDEQMDFLDDYEQPAGEQMEEQVEDPPKVEEQAEQVEEQAEQVEEVEEEEVSLSDQIDSFLADNAKDGQQFARDRSHVVHFNTGSDSLSQQLMKGRDRYMKRLQQYVDGDTSVKVRMMNNKEVLVQSLKPNIASLKDLLATPHGEPRFCVCDC